MTVETANGRLRGQSANGILSFRGIPYAADTGGANRFMPPRPVVSWTGVRDALQLGDLCPQGGGAAGFSSRAGWSAWYGQPSTFSENCCVLNVFTPDLNANARRPVMLYIHGGGFRSGGGGGPALDGSSLARFGDVVVVTVNHRLNVFGYTTLGHLDAEFADAGNVGQLDLIAALTWVKNNIAAFGGDAGRVTLFGQSGGGSKIATLMIMPGANGLFHRAINMSGVTAYSIRPAADRAPLTNEFLKQLGIDRTNLRRLQQLPAEQLLAAHLRAVTELRIDDFRPVVDGRHIPHEPLTREALSIHSSIPMIMGNTETEATAMLGGDPRNVQISEQQLQARIQAQFGLDDAKALAVIAGYRQEKPTRTPWELLAALSTDVLFRGRMLWGAEAKANARQAPVYLYNFVWKVPVDGGIWLSPHTADIPFAFGTIEAARMMTGPGPGPLAVSRNLMSAFVAFARTGNPGNRHMPTWRPYDTTSRATMTVDEPCRLVNDFRGIDRRSSANLLDQDSYQVQTGPLFRGV